MQETEANKLTATSEAPGPTDADIADIAKATKPPVDQATQLVRRVDRLGNDVLNELYNVINSIPGCPFEINLDFASLHSEADHNSREKLSRVGVDIYLASHFPPLFINVNAPATGLAALLYKLSHELERVAATALATTFDQTPRTTLRTVLPQPNIEDVIEFDVLNAVGETLAVFDTRREAEAWLKNEQREICTVRPMFWSTLSSRKWADRRPNELQPLAVTTAGERILKRQNKERLKVSEQRSADNQAALRRNLESKQPLQPPAAS